jgi:hypothetical protein
MLHNLGFAYPNKVQYIFLGQQKLRFKTHVNSGSDIATQIRIYQGDTYHVLCPRRDPLFIWSIGYYGAPWERGEIEEIRTS